MSIKSSSRITALGNGALNMGRRYTLSPAGFSVLAILVDALLITAISVVTGATYHATMYGTAGILENYFIVGALAAILYTMPFVFRNEYTIHHYLDGHRNPGRTALVWNYAFLCLAGIGFMTKTTEQFSRGGLVAFYIAGLCALMVSIFLVRRALKRLIHADRVEVRRVMLAGTAEEIRSIAGGAGGIEDGVRIVATAVLPQPEASTGAEGDKALADAMSAAISNARLLAADDIVILTDWARADYIERVVEGFTVLPVSIHLGAASVVGRFSDARVSRFANLTTLSLTEPPLNPFQALLKRVFDITVATLALFLLSPLFLAVALLIKLTSPGPVFFRQRRLGYNLEEFRIWKFRTMRTMDDGDNVVQATRNDARITWIGRYLRCTSIDELPQLLNVLNGDMSLVGPRPHAVAHDRDYERRIAAYPRRLSMRPGITGWAQVNGHRGATDTVEAMRRRVEHDLYYIDNWSIALDIYIILKTVLSPSTFRNAH